MSPMVVLSFTFTLEVSGAGVVFSVIVTVVFSVLSFEAHAIMAGRNSSSKAAYLISFISGNNQMMELGHRRLYRRLKLSSVRHSTEARSV